MGEAGHTMYGFRPFWTQAAIQYHFDVYTRTNQAFAGKCFCTQVLLQGEAFAQRWFKKRNDFTKGCFYTQVLLHRDACHKDMLFYRLLHIQILLHRDDFGKKKLLDAGTFTHRCLYTEMLLHTVVLTHSYVYAVLLHSSSFAQFYTKTFTQTYFDIH